MSIHDDPDWEEMWREAHTELETLNKKHESIMKELLIDIEDILHEKFLHVGTNTDIYDLHNDMQEGVSDLKKKIEAQLESTK